GLASLLFVSRLTRTSSDRTIILVTLWVKLLASLAYSAIVVYIFRGGDTLGYHDAGIQFANIIRSDLANGSNNYLSTFPFWSLGISSLDRIFSFSGLIHFSLFDSFLASSFVFALIGFAGQILLYRTFVARFPDPRIRVWWRWGVLFFPTLMLWSSGMLKDPIGIFGLGCTVWGVHRFLRRPRLRNACWIAVGAYSLLLFRLQILPVLMIALVAWVLATPRAAPGETGANSTGRTFRSLIRIGLIIASPLAITMVGILQPEFSFASLPAALAEESRSYEFAGVTQPLVSFDPSWSGLLRAWPLAMIVTLYRPFIWEAPGPLGIFAALENLVLLILTLRAIFKVFSNFSILAKASRSSTFLLCLIFVAIFGLGVGLSTPNLGTISRYRIPMIPFFMAALTILEYHFLEFRAQVRQRETAPVVPARRALSQ
ncbi:MAG: hypothetical protein M3380_03500, partial [Chloroflexota bacterium]|nr:hypothetical protein [Chloroflexota bacterium]